MSHWDYRVGFKRHKGHIVDDLTNEVVDDLEELEYGIVECFYNENKEIQFTTENFMQPYGETKEELIECLELMLSDAKKKEVLDLEKLWESLKPLEVEDFMGEGNE